MKNISVTICREESEALRRARHTKRLENLGVSKEQIESLIKEDDVVSISCIYYGNYTVNIGEQIVDVKKKKNGQLVSEKIKKQVILRGKKAAEHYINSKEYNVLLFGNTCCIIKSKKDVAEDISKDLEKTIGRCTITEHDALTVQDVIDIFHPKPIKDSETKPFSGITKKKKKKKQKIVIQEYVLKRLKKKKPTLAKKIENKIKKKKIDLEKINEHKHDHRQMTSLEMKKNKRKKKALMRLNKLEKMKKTQEIKRSINALKKKSSVHNTQQTLNLAA